MFEIAVFATVAYAIAVLAMWLGQRSFIYHPSSTPIDAGKMRAAGYAPFPVRTADGLDLTAWRRPGDAHKPSIVLFHGNAQDASWRIDIAAQAARHGYEVVLATYRGFGGNPGRPSEEGLYADARATLDALRAGPVVLWGESLGTGVAVKMASERRVLGVILQSPYLSVAERAGEIMRWLPAKHLTTDRFDSVSRIADIQAPLLIVHGAQDLIIPFRHGQALFAAARAPKRFVELPDRGHNEMQGPAFEAAVLKFLESLAFAPPRP
ncbi:MAG: alpha/beta hydrolase [Tagaea sp.]|nr:alpha/beta hydrolase [Tagaea sp.]